MDASDKHSGKTIGRMETILIVKGGSYGYNHLDREPDVNAGH